MNLTEETPSCALLLESPNIASPSASSTAPLDSLPHPKSSLFLPFELVSHILQFLNNSHYAIFNSCLVSRTWAAAGVELLWKSPAFTNSSSSRQILAILSQCSNVNRVFAFKYGTFVRTLDFRWPGLFPIAGSSSTISQALQACGPNLKELLLGINAGWILRGNTISKVCPNLCKIDLGNIDCGPKECIDSIGDSITSVTLMDLDLNKNFIVEFFQRRNQYTEIGFSDSWASRVFEPRMTDKELETIVSAMQNTTSLRLRLGGPIQRLREDSAIMLHSIAQRTSKLVHLSLEDSLTTTDLILCTFLRNNPKLRRLSLSSTLLTRVSLAGIAKLSPNLESLSFNLRAKWTVDSISILLPRLASLRHLHLNATGLVVGDLDSWGALSYALANSVKRFTSLEILEPTPEHCQFWDPILRRHAPSLDILSMNPGRTLDVVEVIWILDRCPFLRGLEVSGQKMGAPIARFSEEELARADAEGFTFVFHGKQIRRLREIGAGV